MAPGLCPRAPQLAGELQRPRYSGLNVGVLQAPAAEGGDVDASRSRSAAEGSAVFEGTHRGLEGFLASAVVRLLLAGWLGGLYGRKLEAVTEKAAQDVPGGPRGSGVSTA